MPTIEDLTAKLAALEAERKADAEKLAKADADAQQFKKIATQHQRAYKAMRESADPGLVAAYEAAAVGKPAEFKVTAPTHATTADDEYQTPEQKQIKGLQDQIASLASAFESKLTQVRNESQGETKAIKSREAWKSVESKLGAELFAKLKPAALKHAESMGLSEEDLASESSLSLLFDAAKAPEAEKLGYDRAMAELREKSELLDGIWSPPARPVGVEVPGMEKFKDAPPEVQLRAFVEGLTREAAKNAR